MAMITGRVAADNPSQPEPDLTLTGENDLDQLTVDISTCRVIELHFDSYRDGRLYSMARLLREQHGFSGELRATGDILPDQLRELERCGFDSIEIDDTLLTSALKCVDIVKTHMQPALDRAQ